MGREGGLEVVSRRDVGRLYGYTDGLFEVSSSFMALLGGHRLMCSGFVRL